VDELATIQRLGQAPCGQAASDRSGLEALQTSAIWIFTSSNFTPSLARPAPSGIRAELLATAETYPRNVRQAPVDCQQPTASQRHPLSRRAKCLGGNAISSVPSPHLLALHPRLGRWRAAQPPSTLITVWVDGGQRVVSRATRVQPTRPPGRELERLAIPSVQTVLQVPTPVGLQVRDAPKCRPIPTANGRALKLEGSQR